MVSPNAPSVCSTLAGQNLNISQSCKSFRNYLAYNSPAVICPTSSHFSLCTYNLLLSNRLKRISMFISEVVFFFFSFFCKLLPLQHSPSHIPAPPACPNFDLCLFNPMNQLCSVKVLLTCTVVWKEVPLDRGSYCNCGADLICFCSYLYHSSALPVFQCLETAALYILS